MTIPAIAPVDSLGSFLAAWSGSLSGIFGTGDVIVGLIIDKDGVGGGSETVDGDGDSVGIGGGRAVVVVDDSSLVDVASVGMLIVGGEGGAATNVVVVTREGMSGVSVGLGVWTTVTVNVTGVVSWPSAPNCLSFNPRTAVSSSVLPWALPLLCHAFLLYFACIP